VEKEITMKDIKEAFTRDVPADDTYSVRVVLGNMTKTQLESLNELLDLIESEGIETVSYEEFCDRLEYSR
jgi:hypothetical protein